MIASYRWWANRVDTLGSDDHQSQNVTCRWILQFPSAPRRGRGSTLPSHIEREGAQAFGSDRNYGQRVTRPTRSLGLWHLVADEPSDHHRGTGGLHCAPGVVGPGWKPERRPSVGLRPGEQRTRDRNEHPIRGRRPTRAIAAIGPYEENAFASHEGPSPTDAKSDGAGGKDAATEPMYGPRFPDCLCRRSHTAGRDRADACGHEDTPANPLHAFRLCHRPVKATARRRARRRPTLRATCGFPRHLRCHAE